MGYDLVKMLRKQLEKKIHSIEPMAVLDSKQFLWVKSVEKAYAEIRKEAEEVLKQIDNIIDFDAVLPDQRALYQGNYWKSFFLKALGEDVLEHQNICPNTTRALKNIPGVINAFFSILKPGAYIPPHRGPYAGILRYHLGIIIPQGDVGIKVNGQLFYWKEGESLFFDDSFEHEVWNRTGSKRVILFVDLVRPLPKALSVLNNIMLFAFKSTKTAKLAREKVMNTQIASK